MSAAPPRKADQACLAARVDAAFALSEIPASGGEHHTDAPIRGRRSG